MPFYRLMFYREAYEAYQARKMTISKEEVKQKLIELIDKHQRLKNEGRLKGINEETTKQWIDDLFRILGWDFIEDVIKEYGTGKRKRVDYAFQITGTTKFLLEAKAYGEELEDKYIKQTLEYGYQNNKTWVVLTNFREIRVYNAKYYDKEEHIRRLFEPIRIEDSVARIDDLWVLSRDGMKENLINQLANKYGKVKPKEAIDSLIFEDLMRWRKALEKAIRAHERLNRLPVDPKAAEKYIDEAVQKMLDKIIFVRVCEDRGLEEEELLRWCVREWKADKKVPLMSYLSRLFSKKNDEYDSGIFAAHYSESLTIENEALETIIEESYINPNGLIYDFSAIDADILGTIYENYLAYIQKKVWDKESKQKSKRKAHGIYYTPTYIVNYIVKNTLGEKLKECSKPDEALKIKVLDPACGSGSFLIRAYDEFRNWYTSHMEKNGEKQHTLNHELKGTTEFMDKVLENCIYGVDLDPKAVEIAQLNLLLKSAEGKHKLPQLNHTIQCGNSLIDDPTVAGEYAFKWEEKFPEVFRNGGFDVVVGNPPYISNWSLSEDRRDMVLYLEKHYAEIVQGHWDIYVIFIYKALNLLKKGGYHSFIIPNSVSTEKYASKLRKLIIEKFNLVSLLDFGASTVFENVARQSVVYVIGLGGTKTRVYSYVETGPKFLFSVNQKDFLTFHNYTFRYDISEDDLKLKTKIEKNTIPLANICCVNVGVVAHSNSKSPKQFTKDDVIHETYRPGYKKYVEGKEISRYNISVINHYFDYDSNFKFFHRAKYPLLFDSPKIIIRRISGAGGSLIAVYDDESVYTNDNMIILIKWAPKVLENQKPEKKWSILLDNNYSLKYLLAIINSKLMSYYFNKYLATGTLQGTYSGIYPEDVRTFPIKEATDSAQKRIVEMTEKIINMFKQLKRLGTNSNEAQNLKAEIEKTDAEIDRLVYELYGLTDEEIKIVEET